MIASYFILFVYRNLSLPQKLMSSRRAKKMRGARTALIKFSATPFAGCAYIT